MNSNLNHNFKRYTQCIHTVALRLLVHLGLSSDGLNGAVSLASNTAQQHLKLLCKKAVTYRNRSKAADKLIGAATVEKKYSLVRHNDLSCLRMKSTLRDQ